MSDTTQPASSYDVVPYPSNPFVQAHPDRMATVATLFGLRPQPIDDCRVLEIGCARGGNLLPMAEQLPGSRFVGLDLSGVQIKEARRLARQAGLPHVEFHHLDLLSFPPEFGQFDYIISHGVFSWVPRTVQDKILEICGAHLAPQGVAYISYNTYPGWHMRGMIRDMMCYHVRNFPDAQTRIRQARSLLAFLARNASEDHAYGKLLKDEAELLRMREDAYLFHDHLEEINDPLYFFDFVQRAEDEGLQYLGEAELSRMWVGHLPPDVAETLQQVASDPIRMEQYMDFVRNRMFRRTLLCRQGLPVDRGLKPESLGSFHVACPLAPADPNADVASTQTVKFHCPSRQLDLTTSDPLVKAAMMCLADAWPKAVPFPELLAHARDRLRAGSAAPAERRDTDARSLGHTLLECYVADAIELHCRASCFRTQVSERPLASKVARAQVAFKFPNITTLRHESILLDAFCRRLLGYLDGTRDRRQLLDVLTGLVNRGDLVVQKNGRAIGPSGSTIKKELAAALEHALLFLASHALLAG